MSRTRSSVTVGNQITTLLAGFTLTTAARELVSRFVEADQQPGAARHLANWLASDHRAGSRPALLLRASSC